MIRIPCICPLHYLLWLSTVSGLTLVSTVAYAQNPPSQDPKGLDQKFILSAPLTHSDWILKDNVPGLDDKLTGVRHMLNMCKAAGWNRIYWRCLDAGRSLYPSNLMDPMGMPVADNYFNPKPEEVGIAGAAKNEAMLKKIRERYHYDSIDYTAEAVKYGHQIGIEVHAWLTLNEDDHGWGWPSRYTLRHPEHRWRRKDGTFFRSQLSFAWPEVRDYKLSIVKELLEKYRFDGIFIDWIRTGDVRDLQVDQSGHAVYGYEQILIDRFKQSFKIDPRDLPNDDERWVRHRAEPYTEFMRAVRKLCDRLQPGLPIAVMVHHPWGYRGGNPKYADNLRGLHLDVATWAKEKLMDSVVAAGYYTGGGTPEKAFNHLKELTGGKVDVWLYAWVPNNPDSFRQELQRASALGAKQILFWEADYIDNLPQQEKASLQQLMRSYAAELPKKP